MKVGIISSNFWPEPIGVSQTSAEFARYLAARGLRVTVATALPHYPAWSIDPAYRGALWRREYHDGIEILRAWHHVSPRVSTRMRILHELTLGIFGLPLIVRAAWRADDVFVVSPDLSFAWLGVVIARLLGRRVTLVVKDVMPDAAVELGMLTSPLAIRISEWLARRAYAWAHEIHTLGEGMRRRIGRLGDVAKVRLVPDTVDADELAPVPPEENEFRQRFVPPGTFAVIHTGNMGRKQDLGLVLRAADALRDDPSVRFYVFGDGAAKDEFLAERAQRGLENVLHLPLQERPFLRHMLSGADLVLVSQLPEVVDIVVPSKLVTALAAGAFVVAAAAPDSETARLIRESGGGVLIPAGDGEALVAAIVAARSGQGDPAACRSRGRTYALAHFERGAVYGPIADRVVNSAQ